MVAYHSLLYKHGKHTSAVCPPLHYNTIKTNLPTHTHTATALRLMSFHWSAGTSAVDAFHFKRRRHHRGLVDLAGEYDGAGSLFFFMGERLSFLGTQY